MKTFKTGDSIGVQRLHGNTLMGWATYLSRDTRHQGYHRVEVDVGGTKMIMSIEGDRLLSATEALECIRNQLK